MFRLASPLCPFCDARALARSLSSSWQVTRAASTRPARRPSRMVLSHTVGRSRSPASRDGGTPAARKTAPRRGPFGSMNTSVVPRDVQQARDRAQTTQDRRVHRRSSTKPSSKDKDKVRDPMKALKMQRALSNVSYEKRARTKQDIAERNEQFESFDLMPVIKESVASQALGGLVNPTPTAIQRLAIPALLGTEDGKRRRQKGGSKEMQQFLLAAETGSGKTLAYVLPIIDAIKRAEYAEAAQMARENAKAQTLQQDKVKNKMFELEAPAVEEPDPSTARPRAVIMVPTAELVDQVGHVVKNIGHKVKYRSALLSASYSGKVIRNRLFTTGGIDVVVSTPHLLHSITESDPNILSRVTHLVVDEADSLFDRSFAPITSAIIDRVTPSLRQLILCSATIPRNLDGYLHKRYPDIRRLVTPNLHAIPRRVQLSVVDIEKIPFQGNRDLACAQTIWDIGRDSGEDDGGRDARKLIVFVNEREKASEVAEFLRTKGIDAMALARDSDERKQAKILAEFTGMGTGSRPKGPESAVTLGFSRDAAPSSEGSTGRAGGASRRELTNTKVLVMTDLGSRGIDTLPVRHVILYDVPHTSIDFIHRLGRVGRMGRRGRGVVLVGRHDRRDVVKEVREGMFRGQALI